MKSFILGLCILVMSFGVVVGQEPAKEQQRVVILLGPPGSGKGTQAARLTKELGIPHISTGDLFRENISKSTDLGKRAKNYIDAGQLVPDAVVLEMLFDRVSRPDCAKGYLLDGFPRTIPQAEALDKYLGKGTVLVVLNLQVSDDVIVKRIEGRRLSVQRSDDTAEVVKERLKVYHEQTEPVVAYYQKKGVLKEVNGENAPDVVYSDLMKVFAK